MLRWASIATLISLQLCRSGLADSLTWHTLASGDNLNAVTFANGQFIVAGNGSKIFTSKDGIGWSLRYSGTNAITILNPLLTCITSGNNLIVAAGWKVSVTSTDGLAWAVSGAGDLPTFVYGVAYGKGLFVVVGANGAIMIGQPALQLGPVTPLPDGTVQISVTGSPSQEYPIQASADLVNWMTITNLSSVHQWHRPVH